MTTARDTQAVIEAAYLGTPKARDAQAAIEVAYLADAKARNTQAVIEVAYIDSGVTAVGRSFVVMVG